MITTKDRFLIYAYFLALFLFVSSCTTTKNDFITAPQNSEIYDISKKIHVACFQTAHPNFSGQLSSTEFLPSLHLEGVWKQDNQIFVIQLEGALGEVYGDIVLNQNQIQVRIPEHPQIEKKSFHNLSSLLSSLGASGTRNLICGNYAFDLKTGSSFLFSKLDQRTYLSQSVLEIDHRQIDAENKIVLEKSDGKTKISIKTHFSYGFLIRDSDVEVQWIGSIQGQIVKVDSIVLVFKDKKINSLAFDEYE